MDTGQQRWFVLTECQLAVVDMSTWALVLPVATGSVHTRWWEPAGPWCVTHLHTVPGYLCSFCWGPVASWWALLCLSILFPAQNKQWGAPHMTSCTLLVWWRVAFKRKTHTHTHIQVFIQTYVILADNGSGRRKPRNINCGSDAEQRPGRVLHLCATRASLSDTGKVQMQRCFVWAAQSGTFSCF